LIFLLDIEPATGDSEERPGEEGNGEIPDCRSNAASRCCCLFFSRRKTPDSANVASVQASSGGVLQNEAKDLPETLTGDSTSSLDSSSESSSETSAQNLPRVASNGSPGKKRS
jgi:hypothetical protein